MDKLWAPWRAKYITTLGKKTGGCIFCKIVREKRDKENYIFIRTKHSYSVLNIYPYNNGHVLVLPFKHVNDFTKLLKEEKEDFFNLLELTKAMLQDVLKPHGYNIGMNIGRAAGAGVPGHMHMHIVPRWRGDANFMPVVGSATVMSFSLKELSDRLRRAYTKRH